ncbi:hypothetical protein IFR05_012620 [Cadophora sp. M221]|nr:hypothetical protein IFR05_012620 [Cadophora sp. M221]
MTVNDSDGSKQKHFPLTHLDVNNDISNEFNDQYENRHEAHKEFGTLLKLDLESFGRIYTDMITPFGYTLECPMIHGSSNGGLLEPFAKSLVLRIHFDFLVFTINSV